MIPTATAAWSARAPLQNSSPWPQVVRTIALACTWLLFAAVVGSHRFLTAVLAGAPWWSAWWGLVAGYLLFASLLSREPASQRATRRVVLATLLGALLFVLERELGLFTLRPWWLSHVIAVGALLVVAIVNARTLSWERYVAGPALAACALVLPLLQTVLPINGAFGVWSEGFRLRSGMTRAEVVDRMQRYPLSTLSSVQLGVTEFTTLEKADLPASTLDSVDQLEFLQKGAGVDSIAVTFEDGLFVDVEFHID